jgi:hypothetical protein
MTKNKPRSSSREAQGTFETFGGDHKIPLKCGTCSRRLGWLLGKTPTGLTVVHGPNVRGAANDHSEGSSGYAVTVGPRRGRARPRRAQLKVRLLDGTIGDSRPYRVSELSHVLPVCDKCEARKKGSGLHGPVPVDMLSALFLKAAGQRLADDRVVWLMQSGEHMAGPKFW